MENLHPPNHPLRLDRHISDCLHCSRQQAKVLIQSHQVLINNHPEKPSYSVLPTDDITYQPCTPDAPRDNLFPSITPYIIAEDSEILIINKPAGLITHPAHDESTSPAVSTLVTDYDPSIANVGDPGRPGIVHRLDQLTTGLLVIAKTPHAFTHLKAQFHDHLVQKKYYAMVYGNIEPDYLCLDASISYHPSKYTKRHIDPNGQSATTHVHVIQRFNSKTWVRLEPITGRTHQLRVHLASIQHPIIGDALYAPDKPSTQNLCLQSYFLRFRHPSQNQDYQFTIPSELT